MPTKVFHGPMMNHEYIHEVLKKYWGYEGLRGIQASVIQAVLEERDVLALMPTGGGKSLCFQLPTLMRDGLCLVVSPLIALMQDQLQHLREKGIAAAALHSGLSSTEVNRLYDELEQGYYRFLYVSPERLQTASFLNNISAIDVRLLVVDEAHCIAEWGYDFRPAYLKIGALRKELPGVPCLALTASATPAVKEDILARLEFKNPLVLTQDFIRPNLSYGVDRCLDVSRQYERLLDLLGLSGSSSVLVYTRSRRAAEVLASQLKVSGYSAEYYHAGLTGSQREDRLTGWLKTTPRIMVCTSAFGMGIDKPDVRLVVHYGPPENLESYYQQAGRAGRDGQPASAWLLYTNEDLQYLQQLPSLLYPPFTVIQQFYQDLADYLQLPVGLGEDRFFSFQLTDFAQKFKWPPLRVHSILKALEQSGLITYLEQVYLPSKIRITATRAEIAAYAEGVKAPGEVLDFLMRHYEHIFVEPVTIREGNIAWQLYIDEARLRKILMDLHKQGLIRYLPARNLPQLHFLTGRAPAASFIFDHKRYAARRKWYEWRLDMLQRYLGYEDRCRSQMLAAYFGQHQPHLCGVCDNCQAGVARPLPGART